MQVAACIRRHPTHFVRHARTFQAVFIDPFAIQSKRSMSVLPHVLEQAVTHRDRVAVVHQRSTTAASEHWTYAQLLHHATKLRDEVREEFPQLNSSANARGAPPRIAFLGARGPDYVMIQWATWLLGGMAVPLHPAHPQEELEYILNDADASVLLVSRDFIKESTASLAMFVKTIADRGQIPVKVWSTPSREGSVDVGQLHEHVERWRKSDGILDRGAHMVYTSGTTGRPKGVVTTHSAMTTQVQDIVTAWEMDERDHLLHFLPLHHVHGILNNLLCPLYVGGSVEFLPHAKAPLIWSKLGEAMDSIGKDKQPKQVSMLMAVPTIYMNLLETMEQWQNDPLKSKEEVNRAIEAVRQLRVAISGSMACPVSILNRWQALTGHCLLERYGMTELGMVLTNPLHGERHFGYVGKPFPSVQVRLVDPDTEQELGPDSENEGELRVKGPTVFHEYWGKPEATAKEFDLQGWFKTGDIAQYSKQRDSYRIRGRASADIIKSGGYKLSALDIERVLLTHPQIHECAVFGLPDEKWGQVVAAVVRSSLPHDELEQGSPENALDPQLKSFAAEHLADYKIPRHIFVVRDIPKNAMGKVNKKALAKLFQENLVASEGASNLVDH